MKAFALFLLTLLTGSVATAQTFKIAPMFGPNVTVPLMSKEARDAYELADYDYGVDFKTNFPPAVRVQAGILAEYGITEKFSVQSGLMVNARGFNYKFKGDYEDDYGYTSRASVRLNSSLTYLEIPLAVKLAFGESGIKLQAGLGVGFAVNAHAKAVSNIDGDIDRESERLTIGTDPYLDDVKPLDLSVSLGLSKDIMLGDNPLEIGAFVQPSITAWSPMPSDQREYQVRHLTFGIRAAYFFTINR